MPAGRPKRSSAPTTGASSAVYSCLSGSTSTEDHFVSTSSARGGALSLGLLGYVLDSAPLDRYNGGFHWVTTGSPPSGYGLEGTLGYLINAGPDTSPLYGCIQNSDQFLSKDRGCEGQTLIGLEGWIYDDPPSNVATVAVYRCSVPGSDHFAADDPNCEGLHTDGLLGYALGQPIPVPTAAPSGGYEIAFQANTGVLWVTGSAGTLNTGLAMAPGTSPAIAGLVNGGYEVAFQTAPPPPAPVVVTPVSTPVPTAPPGKHRLRVKLTLKWTWNHARTRLVKVRLGRHPHDVTLHVRCRGAGCPTRRVQAARLRRLTRLIRALEGKRYRAGDRIFLTLTSARFRAERIQITIRKGTIPAVKLL